MSRRTTAEPQEDSKEATAFGPGSSPGLIARRFTPREREREREGTRGARGISRHVGERLCKSFMYVPMAWSWSRSKEERSATRWDEVRRAEAKGPGSRRTKGTRNPASMPVRHDPFRMLRCENSSVPARCLSLRSDELSRREPRTLLLFPPRLPVFRPSYLRTAVRPGLGSYRVLCFRVF